MSARTFRDVCMDLDTVVLLIKSLGVRDGVRSITWDAFNQCTVDLHFESFDEVFGLGSLNVRTYTSREGLFAKIKKRGIVFRTRV